MKKHLLPIVVAVCALLTACNTPRKLYEAKAYDEVIMKTAPKLCAGRVNPEYLDLVARSYHQANQADHERILALKATGQPDIWPEVFERYCSMKGRYEALSCLPKQAKQSIHYEKLNVDEPMKAAQNKAEAYLEAKIAQVLQSTNANLDSADRLIHALQRVNPTNTRLNEFKSRSLLQRAGVVLAYCTTRRGTSLPIGVEQALLSFDPDEKEALPVTIHYGKHRGMKYGALMEIKITRHEVTPNRDEAVSFKENQNNLTATVTDHTLSKTATIKGLLNLYEPKRGDLLVSIPLEANSKFSYSYSTLEGPSEACSAQTLEQLKRQPVPFPTDASILTDAANEFNDLIVKTLSNH